MLPCALIATIVIGFYSWQVLGVTSNDSLMIKADKHHKESSDNGRATTDIHLEETADQRKNDVHHRESWSWSDFFKKDCNTYTCPRGAIQRICGSDEKTYQNPCFFEQARCIARETGKTLEKNGDGPCINKKCERKSKWKNNFCVSNVAYGCWKNFFYNSPYCWVQKEEGSTEWCWIYKKERYYDGWSYNSRLKIMKCDVTKSKREQAVF